MDEPVVPATVGRERGESGVQHVDDDAYARVCEECHQQVTWTAWRLDHNSHDSEMREGRCRCEDKGFLQFRPLADASALT